MVRHNLSLHLLLADVSNSELLVNILIETYDPFPLKYQFLAIAIINDTSYLYFTALILVMSLIRLKCQLSVSETVFVQSLTPIMCYLQYTVLSRISFIKVTLN